MKRLALIVALALVTLAMVGRIVFPAFNSLGLLIGTVIWFKRRKQ